MSGSESTKAPESFQVPERSRPSLVNHRNLAYSILKKLGDDAVKDAEFTDLGKCPQCDKDILSPPFEAFTTLPCGHVFHRECVENKFLLTCQNNCPVADCNATVKPVVSERRFSVTSSQSTAASLVRRMSNQLQVDSPVIQEDPMEGVQDTLNQETETRLTCAKCSEEITLDFSKDTVLLSCKHVVHYDCINNPQKLCPICQSSEGAEARGKRSSEFASETVPSKKAKKQVKREDSPTLKKLIRELTSPTYQQAEGPISLQSSVSEISEMDVSSLDFLDLYNKIDTAEDNLQRTTQIGRA